MTFPFTERERALLDAASSAFDTLADTDIVVVDWRSEFEDILDEFARFLPPGYLAMDVDDADEITVSSGHGIAVVRTDGEPPFGLDLAAAIAVLLAPDFEAHAFRESLESDTHCYLVRPSAWWDALRDEYPVRYDDLFASDAELPSRFVVSDGP